MRAPTPQAIVRELDKYIVGQGAAKRVVAIALRNRERRRKLSAEIRRDIMPKNILMIGPTGVGKTEIARRMAALVDAPLIKVEATKFTEVGYVGRDVESIISDLVETAVMKVYEKRLEEVKSRAEKQATERIIDYLCQQWPRAVAQAVSAKAESSAGRMQAVSLEDSPGAVRAGTSKVRPGRRSYRSRQHVAQLVLSHQLEDQLIDIEVGGGESAPSLSEVPLPGGPEEGDAFGDLVDSGRGYGREKRWKKVPVKDARRILAREEANRLVDFDDVVEDAIEQTEEGAVVFIDEMDKLAGPKVEMGRDVSGEGVQRDLLPIVEGTTVMTRFGPVRTEHVLFIGAGTFYQSKPSDLIPELQGRFPLRVELAPLSQEDLQRILTEPKNALTKQAQALLATEGVELVFTEDGIAEITRLATVMNERAENIGARRLHTIVEGVLEDLNFTAPEKKGQRVVVDRAYVSEHIGDLIADEDLSRYIL